MVRHRFLILLFAATGVFLIGLSLVAGAPVHGERVVIDADGARDRPSLQSLSLQSTEPITSYLPLVSRAYPPPPPIFGVQMHSINAVNGLEQAVDGGVHWVRYSAFHWDRIEPLRTHPPTYHWTEVDEAGLRNARDNGLQVIATVQFTPLWAQKYSGSYCGPIHQDWFDEFAQFLTALVRRYKDPPYSVRYWELGNEPDAPLAYSRSVMGCWGMVGDPYYGGRTYGEMLKHAYPAIKAADPEAKVLIGGLLLDRPSGGTDNHPRFLEGILQAGGGPYFDMVSFHAYSYYSGAFGQMSNPNWPGSVTAVPEKTAFLKSVLNRYGYGDKALLNTEAAMLCFSATTQCLDTQGMYIPRAYADALAMGLTAQVYYDLKGTWRNSGLLYPDLTPKPVYYAYQAAAGFLSAARYLGPVSVYPGNPKVAGYTFKRGDQPGFVDVVWSVDGSNEIVILPAGASAFDRYGAPTPFDQWVDVNIEPVYITRPQ